MEMSNYIMEFKKQLDAKLNGYEGPIFPNNIKVLNKKLEESHNFMYVLLKDYVRDNNFQLIDNITIDECSWSYIIEYDINKINNSKDIFKQKLLLLIPVYKHITSGFVRSCTFYKKGDYKLFNNMMDDIVNDLVSHIHSNPRFMD
jgi:hypothetical protein